MEAMTGASATGLTLYDMTKSLGLGIEISSVRLLSKPEEVDFKSKIDSELYGLVLAGGFSKRMNGQDLIYRSTASRNGKSRPNASGPFAKVFLSIRGGQHLDGLGEGSSEALVDTV